MRDLEVTYKRLLLAYPRAYRRERGLEILTTLMDSAASGRRRPSRRDAFDLVLSGLRYRFSPPRGWLHWSAAAVLSVFIGLLVAGYATGPIWESPQTTPRADQMPNLVDLPPAETSAPRVSALSHDFLGKNTAPRLEGWDGSAPTPGYREHVYRPDTMDAIVLELYERMPRDGWRMGQMQQWEAGMVFWAERDGVIVRVQGFRLDGSTPSISVRAHVTEPALTTPVALAGLVLGVLTGWLSACGLMRRAGRLTPGWQAGAFTLGLISVAAQALVVLAMLGGLILLVSNSGWAQHHWLAPLTMAGGIMLPFTFVAISTLVGTATIALAAPTHAVAYRRGSVSP